ncbi:MAG TPA: hypothetical protein VFJ64_09535 [Solirubrobacterales bacterium]|nr:hypothetical protein [Solirubrobacterales bacterium]
MRSDAQMVAEVLEVLVEVQDLDPGILSRGDHRQVGEGKAMGTMGTTGCELAHRRQDRTLHPAIHLHLAQALQGPFDRGDPIGTLCGDHQLVANRPTPAEFVALDRT